MNTLSKLLSVTAALGLSTAAMAQPSPHDFPLVYSGIVSMQKGTGPELDCVVVMTFNETGPVNIRIDAEFPDPCATIILDEEDYEFDFDHFTGQLDVYDVYANTTITTGDCAGDLVATKVGSTIFVDDVLPQVTTGGDCVLAGSLSFVP